MAVSELCDGSEDCEAGEDEAPSLCSSHVCSHGVRCEESDTCLYTPHYQLCSPDHRAVCSDGSDEAHCHNRQFTGCFRATNLGLRICDCASCYCHLLDRQAVPRPLTLTSSSPSWRSTNITANICIDTSSKFMCNGVIDCIGGADEDEDVCRDIQQGRGASRRGKQLSLGPTSGRALDQVAVATTSVVVILISVILSAVFVLLYRKYLKRSCSSNDFIQLEYKDSIATESVYVTEESRRFSDYWSLQNNKIIQEIGRGHFSRVYLGRNLKSSELVALKILNTADENDLRRETDILARLASHANICQMLGFNVDENTLVLEYCVFGNLKDFVSKQLKTSTTIFPFPRWCYEIAEAMDFVGTMGVIHRDLALR